MLVVKKPMLYDDVFFYIKGEHLLKVNRLTQTLIKRCQSKMLKNIKRLLQKENHYETHLCFINKNGGCEKTKKVTR